MSQTPGRRLTRAASRAGSETPAPAATASASRRGGTPGTDARRRVARQRPIPTTDLPALSSAPDFAYGSRGKVVLENVYQGGGDDDEDEEFIAQFEERRKPARPNARAIEEHLNGPGVDLASNAATETQRRTIASRQTPGATRVIQTIHEETGNSSDQNENESDDDDYLLPQVQIGQDQLNGVSSGPAARGTPRQGTSASGRTGNANATSVNVNDSQTATDLDTGFSYVGPQSFSRRRTPSATPGANRREASIAAAVLPMASDNEIEQARPWTIAAFLETIPRWLRDLLTETRFPFYLLVVALLLLPMLFSSYGRIFEALKELESMPSALLQSIGSQVDSTREAVLKNGPLDKVLIARVGAAEDDIGTLKDIGREHRKRLDEASQAIDELKQILPEHLIIQKNQKTGIWEIPYHFWQALSEKLSSEYSIGKGGKLVAPSTPSWNAFMHANKAELERYVGRQVENQTNIILGGKQRSGVVVDKETFVQLINKNNAKIEASLVRRTERIAKDVALEAVAHREYPTSKHAGKYLSDLILTNLARNLELLERRTNYFSAALGAVVNPYLTSPTHAKPQPGVAATIYAYFFDTPPHPPVHALERWSEATDCWCAASSLNASSSLDQKKGMGKAQLGVIMPHAIIPTSFTIEHVPAEGTLDIASAPKELEVWVKSPDIARRLARHKSRDPLKVYDEDEEYEDSLAVQGFPECTDPAPGDGYICVGRGRYDIHGQNHVQNFPIFYGQEVGLVRNAVVRVVENWGRDWTCLYRVRLHGRNEDDLKAEQEARDEGRPWSGGRN